MAAGSNMTIREEDIRASILSAVEDKMRRRLREVFQQAQVEKIVKTQVINSFCNLVATYFIVFMMFIVPLKSKS